MIEISPAGETFEDFRRSFSYGKRNDLSFKFLANLSDEEAADFLQSLLSRLGETMDDGNLARIVDHIIAGQTRAYQRPGRKEYQPLPLQQMQQPLSKSRLALISSTGHFVDGDDPCPLGCENMSQEEAVERIGDFVKEEPQLSEIPIDTAPENLKVRHGGYDIRAVLQDHNVAFPLDRLRAFEKQGAIGEFHDPAYSFVGACSQSKLLQDAAPKWLKMLQSHNVNAVLLVPV